MAYDEDVATRMRDWLGEDGITEKKMFGGLCFLYRGNMVSGVMKDYGMARVGKQRHDAALAIEGAGPMQFTGRPMGGMVEIDGDLIADDERFGQVMKMAFENAASLPPK